MQQHEITELIEKYLHGTASPEERKRLLRWYRAQEPSTVEWTSGEEEGALSSRIYAEIEHLVHQEEPKHAIGRSYYSILAAAVVLIVLSIGLVFYSNDHKPGLKHAKAKLDEQTLPGEERATLTLSDGTRIILDSARNAVLGRQEGVIIQKTADGQLTYTFSDSQAAGSADHGTPGENFNIIETPAGGTYSLQLSDGSEVFLNSSSTLKFPVCFAKGERKVLLDGEAYFEVAHDAAKPFRVQSGEQIVQVLGTRFNVNAYKNEPLIKTTLLEGSVKVSQRNSMASRLLKPGQEARLSGTGEMTVATADTVQALGWRKGFFVFNDLQLVDIMRQLERWYNVNIDYSTIPRTRFNGVISRDVPLAKALQMLEVTGGVEFKVEAGTVKISQ